jgi:hypothetical protein
MSISVRWAGDKSESVMMLEIRKKILGHLELFSSWDLHFI